MLSFGIPGDAVTAVTTIENFSNTTIESTDRLLCVPDRSYTTLDRLTACPDHSARPTDRTHDFTLQHHTPSKPLVV